jgi:glycosyltransferase involved in cell wall biosynthesis
MRHLLICTEFPPAAGGGIGTYADTLTRLLSRRGELVHVIAPGSGRRHRTERREDGVVVHRIPWTPQFRAARDLLGLSFRPKPFLWRAALLAERIVEEEQIDVVEAQEYQAPLYWYQVRRALGVGPERKPPCLVHLHSPTLLIARHNGWRAVESVRGTVRLERFTVRAADAVVAPSRELAEWARAHYRLRAPVQVIPYPLEAATPIERTRDTWAAGTVCYVGRLDARKGVFEWIDAAVRAAEEHPRQRFELVGADNRWAGGPSARQELLRRIPDALQDRFYFAGLQPRAALGDFLARARIAVVPSRWDNAPYSCLEAMRSGLPALGTRTGGIAEVVQPGRSGWLAEPANADDLHARLDEALRTPPAVLSAMGRRAAEDVARACDPERVVDQQLELRGSLRYLALESRIEPPLLRASLRRGASQRGPGTRAALGAQ